MATKNFSYKTKGYAKSGVKSLFSGTFGKNFFWFILALLAIAFFSSFSNIFKKISSFIYTPSDESAQKEVDMNKELVSNVSVAVNKFNLKRDLLEYKKIASDQFNAMDGLGTDTDLLFKSLVRLNSDELKQVYVEFGTRALGWGGPERDLITCYRQELSDRDFFSLFNPTDISELNLMKSVWNETGLFN